ncbi:MAG: glycosyltransferase [Desulfobacterales bacterium]
MKIIFYCQHVLGMGHFFRSLEICKALSDHEVIFVTGGASFEVELMPHIRKVNLPGLMMDPNFSGFYTTEKKLSLEEVREDRKKLLFDLFESEKPDIFMVELYPFGRKAFGFELDPLLKNIRKKHRHRCQTICSLRDILVEKKDPEKYEKRVVKILNSVFDVLLIHSDPTIFSLDESFSRIKDIHVPLVYTGFVTAGPPSNCYRAVRRKLKIGTEKKLVVASAGGGMVGFPLLEATLKAAVLLEKDIALHLVVFSGPFMSQNDFDRLKRLESEDRMVKSFTPDFLSYLAAADLSVSMAGYNTCMNILSAKTPAIVWPFSQNREQRFRAERLAQKASFKVLNDEDLMPERLAVLIRKRLLHKKLSTAIINLQGSMYTAQWLNSRRTL